MPRLPRLPHLTPRATRRILLLFVGVLLPLFVFGMLADDVMEKELFSFDDPILMFMHRNAHAVLDNIAIGASFAASAWVLVPFNLALTAWLYRRGDGLRALFFLMATGGSALLNLLAKPSFARNRPDLWLSIQPETNFSFPSGHAMGSMAVAAAIVCLVWRQPGWRWVALAAGVAFALLVGTSRVYLGVHFPSDVMAGYLASLGWVIGLALLIRIRGSADQPLVKP